MREHDDMLRSLPVAYRHDAWVVALTGAAQAVDEGQRDAAREAAGQLFLDAMTYVLPVEERIAGITPGKGDTVAARRSVLQAKWRSAAGKCDLAQIRAICNAWEGVTAQVDYDAAQYRIVILFRSWGVLPTDMDSVRQTLRETIPAHLAFTMMQRLLRETQAATRLAAAGVRAKHYGEHEVTL